MEEYTKIDTIWKRDMSRNGVIMVGDYSCFEFEYLAENRWIGTEKVDGTNIRVMWNGDNVRFGGRTDSAQINATLVAKLQDLFSAQALGDHFGYGRELLPESSPIQVCLYGEGYGARIQGGGGNYIKDGVDFVLFDVTVVGDDGKGNMKTWWLRRDGIESVAESLGIKVVPIIFTGTLAEACAMTEAGFESTWGPFQAEGLVLKPAVDMRKRDGERLLAKIKVRDYEQLNRKA